MNTLSPIERLELIKQLFDITYEAFEEFQPDHVGADLAYLIGAIADPPASCSFVDWRYSEIGRPIPLLTIIKENFDAKHDIWGYILKDEGQTVTLWNGETVETFDTGKDGEDFYLMYEKDGTPIDTCRVCGALARRSDLEGDIDTWECPKHEEERAK